MQVIGLHLYLKCHSSTGPFSQILLKTNYLVCLNGTLAGNGLITVLKYLSLKIWSVWKPAIANHLSSFCLITVLTKNCFWTKSSKFVNVLKSVLGIDLFRYECKLVIFFSPLKCYVRNVPFSFAVAQKFILNDSLVLKFLVFFSGYTEDLFAKKLCLRLPFLHRNLSWKSTV